MILFVPDVHKGALCQNHFRKGAVKDKDLPSRDKDLPRLFECEYTYI